MRDELKAVNLPAAERAVFMELQQQVIAQDMKLRDGGKAEINNDRARRSNELLRTSKSPEEALLKCSSHAHLPALQSGDSALLASDVITQAREEQYKSLCKELKDELDVAAWLMQRCTTPDTHYTSWKGHVRDPGLGDPTATQELVKMIGIAEARGMELDGVDSSRPNPKSRAKKVVFKEPEKGPGKKICEKVRELRNLAGHLRGLSDELVSRARALRFAKTVRRVQPWQSEGMAAPVCSYCHCKASAPEKITVLGLCGHLVCDDCLASTVSGRDCVVTGCRADVLDYHKIKACELGHRDQTVTSATFYGKKLVEIIQLIKDLPANDQVLLFVQFDDLMETISSALCDHGLTHYALTEKASKHAPKMMEKFQSNTSETKRKVMLLNSGNESAAGA